MKIKWLGKSCFIITSKNGTKIMTDPYAAMLRQSLPGTAVRIVTTSRAPFGQEGAGARCGDFRHIKAPGLFAVDGISIKGIDTNGGDMPDTRESTNIIYNMRIDGISVCHCGDLEQPLSTGQVAAIGTVDVLLLPVGGGFTLGPGGAAEVMVQLRPTVVIPMHYPPHTGGAQGARDGKVDTFISIAKLKANTYDVLDLDRAGLRGCAGIAVLKYYWS